MPPRERLIRATPVAIGGSQIISSPFQFTVTGEDNLRIRSFCSQTGVTLSVDVRLADAAGVVSVASHQHTPNSDRTVRVQDIALPQGYILNMVVRVVAGAVVNGQCYVVVELIRGFTGATIVLGQLLGGYVLSQQGLAWPGSAIEPSTAGQGAAGFVNLALGGAGTEVLATVPAGARWAVDMAFLVYVSTTGATVYPRLSYLDALGNLIYITRCASAVAAPASTNYIYARGGGEGIDNGAHVFQPLAIDVLLRAGSRIQTLTSGMALADSYAAARVSIREWLEAAT